MASLNDNAHVLYCASKNPYSNPPLQMNDAYKTQEEAFPSVCFKSHWDPAAASQYIIPEKHETLPLSFRPMTRIGTSYYTSDEGTFLNSAKLKAVDAESDLQSLNRPLSRYCPTRYVPTKDLSKQGCPEPVRMTYLEKKVLDEVNRPKATIRDNDWECRAKEDIRNSEVSGRIFNNPTRVDRIAKATINARATNQVTPQVYYS